MEKSGGDEKMDFQFSLCTLENMTMHRGVLESRLVREQSQDQYDLGDTTD